MHQRRSLGMGDDSDPVGLSRSGRDAVDEALLDARPGGSVVQVGEAVTHRSDEAALDPPGRSTQRRRQPDETDQRQHKLGDGSGDQQRHPAEERPHQAHRPHRQADGEPPSERRPRSGTGSPLRPQQCVGVQDPGGDQH